MIILNVWVKRAWTGGYMNETVIKIEGLTKIYKLYDRPVDRLKESIHLMRKKYHRDFYALKNVSFDVLKGETIGIVGKNGSGKSTLLKIITGVLTPTYGNISVDGKISALLELGAGFNPEFTGMDNIYLNGTIMGYSKEEMDSKISEIISFADIGDFINQPVKMYSSGMFARLAFAVSINVEPDILIVDEALSVGDIRFQAKCFNKFKELREIGTTILYVGHDVSGIRNFCDRALWLNEGVVESVGDTLNVTAQYSEFMFSNISNKLSTEEIEEEKENLLDNKINEVITAINRWGMKEGMIKSIDIFNENNVKKDIFEFGEWIKIRIRAYIPKDVELSSLSFAFSIKNSMGLDLIVSTTKDYGGIIFNRKDCEVLVEFDFRNILAASDYILVVAVENRSNIVPEYYDYIEGAKCFKVVNDKQLFGLLHIDVNKKVEYL